MNDPRDLHRAADEADATAKELRHQANRAEADRLWGEGNRAGALAFLYGSGHGDLRGYCLDKGLTEGQTDEAIRTANIDFR